MAVVEARSSISSTPWKAHGRLRDDAHCLVDGPVHGLGYGIRFWFFGFTLGVPPRTGVS